VSVNSTGILGILTAKVNGHCHTCNLLRVRSEIFVHLVTMWTHHIEEDVPDRLPEFPGVQSPTQFFQEYLVMTEKRRNLKMRKYFPSTTLSLIDRYNQIILYTRDHARRIKRNAPSLTGKELLCLILLLNIFATICMSVYIYIFLYKKYKKQITRNNDKIISILYCY